MQLHGWIAVGTLVVAAILFLTRWVRLEVTALAIPVVLYATRTVPEAEQVLQGFGNHAVIAIASVFVLGAGLQESGLAAWIARAVQRVGGQSEVRLMVVVCTAVAILSAFMSNAATVAVLMPAVIALGRRAKIPASRLLMPMSFAAILGGILTLIGTASNLLVSDYLRGATGRGFGMFDFALAGLPITIVGIAFLVLVGRRLLPSISRENRFASARLPEDLARSYELGASLTRLRIGKASRLLGRDVRSARLGEKYQLNLLLVVRTGAFGTKYLKPEPSLRFELDDDLYVEGEVENAMELAEREDTRVGLASQQHLDRVMDHGVSLAELSVPPHASMLGKTIPELEFRKRYGLSVLALWRGADTERDRVAERPLEVGDTILVAGPVQRIRELDQETDLLLLTRQAEQYDFSKAPLALMFLLLAVLPPLANGVPLAISALAGAVGMVLTGCVSPTAVQRAIDWKVLALIVGTLPLGAALERHGVAAQAGQAVVDACAGFGTPAVLAVLFFLSAVVSITSSNAAAAVILSPVAAQAAVAIGLELRHALLAVAYGCSCAFLLPFAHQCNLMVQVPGGYATRDFLRVGGLMSLAVAATAVTILALL